MYFHQLLQYSGNLYMRNREMLFTFEVNMIITLLQNHLLKVENIFFGKLTNRPWQTDTNVPRWKNTCVKGRSPLHSHNHRAWQVNSYKTVFQKRQEAMFSWNIKTTTGQSFFSSPHTPQTLYIVPAGSPEQENLTY